jgi:hypothetical protein
MGGGGFRVRSESRFSRELGGGFSMYFAPVGRGNAFPDAESPDKRVGIFISEEISSLVQFQQRISKIVASEPVRTWWRSEWQRCQRRRLTSR